MNLQLKAVEEKLLQRSILTDKHAKRIYLLDRSLDVEELSSRFMNNLLYGNYWEILAYFEGTMMEHKSLVESITTEDDLFLAIKSYMLCQLEDDSDETLEKGLHWRVFEVFMLGVAYLELYCQTNYTGPELTRDERAKVDVKEEEEQKKSLFLLECDGNFAHHTVDMPHLLLFGRIILSLLAHPQRASWKNGIRLNQDGEVIPPTLALEDQFRQELIESFSFFHSLGWWNARACIFHARLLMNQNYDTVPTLWNEARLSFQSVLVNFAALDRSCDLLSSELLLDSSVLGMWSVDNRLIATKAWLEWGLACHFFSFGDKGKKKFSVAQTISQLETYLTAALGKRTKYQRENIAQLLLYAKSNFLKEEERIPSASNTQLPNTTSGESQSSTAQFLVKDGEENQSSEFEIGRRVIQETTAGEEVVVREVLLDQVNTGTAENIILEGGPHFAQPETVDNGGDLHPLDQAIILALCLDVSNHNPVDGLTNEEMQPYIERILTQPHNWMIHSTALLERSWIEFERRKTADRAMLQIQALIDQHSTKLTITQASYQAIEDSAKNYERLSYLYQLIYPSQFELKKDLARKYLQCQVFQSALNYFKELAMWDEVITCYQFMNKPQRAEMIVREQLRLTGETPYLMTTLADLTSNESLYEQAWQLSNGRYPRAKRTLAKICYDRGDYRSCIAHLDQALAVQPLVHTAWYLKGIACMRVEAWEEGVHAFVRCIQLENEIGEAWTNLAAIYMRQMHWKKAYDALSEARKYKVNDFRILENLLTTTLQLEKWKESIQLIQQLVDLRGKSSLLQQQQSATASTAASLAALSSSFWYQELRYLAKILPSLYLQHLSKKEQATEVADTTSRDTPSQQQAGLEKEEEEEEEVREGFLFSSSAPRGRGEVSREDRLLKRQEEEYSVQSLHYNHLLQDFEALLQKITVVVRSDPIINEILTSFYQQLGRYRQAYDYQVKQIRAIINEAGWERREDFVMLLGSASEKLWMFLQKPELLKKEDYFSSRMLLQSSMRKLQPEEVFTAKVAETMKEVIGKIEEKMKSL